MMNGCDQCGLYRAYKTVFDPRRPADGSVLASHTPAQCDATCAVASCPHCGQANPFQELPLLDTTDKPVADSARAVKEWIERMIAVEPARVDR